MAQIETPRPAGGEQSLGDLVALATRDLSHLVRYEVSLAKTELRADLRRAGIGDALVGIAAFVGCLVLLMLCFALAYGLMALGIWGWAAFLIVAGACVLLAGISVGIAYLAFRRVTGLRRTRESVRGTVSVLRRRGAGASGTGGAAR